MELVALFIAGGEDFFVEEACVNCPVDRFCACDDADVLFDVWEVMGQRLVDVGEGIRVSEPVTVERGLRCEKGIFYASLSHRGVLAIYSYSGKSIIQFTDLHTDRQVELDVENTSLVGFYDDNMILLTWYKPLREATVEDVFRECDISQFRKIGKVDGVCPFTDVSLLNETRVLYYPTTDYRLFSYNVDTGVNAEVDVGKKVWFCASLTGIDCGTKVVFQGGNITYALNTDNTISEVGERQNSLLTTVFPSSTDPTDLRKAAFKYYGHLVFGGKKVEFWGPFKLEWFYSVVRVYKDIFLLYNWNTRSWVLSRIIVPQEEPAKSGSPTSSHHSSRKCCVM